MSSSSKNLPSDAVWLITGCSSGLGAALATHISNAGYRLVATARKVSSLSYLQDSTSILKLRLDVTSSSEIVSVVAAAVEKFGRIDVVINNAGYGLCGDFESTKDSDARMLLETNFWGPVNMTKEALRVFREVNSKGEGGTVVQVSSMGGYIAFPANAFYHASKFGLEGFTESVAKEMHPDWNIDFLLVEPGGIQSEFTKSLVVGARHPAYLDPGCPFNRLLAHMANPNLKSGFADPAVVARAMVETVVGKGDRRMPFRLPLGSDAWGFIKAENDVLNKELDEWKELCQSCSSEEQLKSVAFLQTKSN